MYLEEATFGIGICGLDFLSCGVPAFLLCLLTLMLAVL